MLRLYLALGAAVNWCQVAGDQTELRSIYGCQNHWASVCVCVCVCGLWDFLAFAVYMQKRDIMDMHGL